MEGFMMLEELEDPMYYGMNNSMTMMAMQDETSQLKMVSSAATQTAQATAPPGSRKIKPVKHPALKLQTPIAYQSDTDHNVIPIQPEGRGLFEVVSKCFANLRTVGQKCHFTLILCGTRRVFIKHFFQNLKKKLMNKIGQGHLNC